MKKLAIIIFALALFASCTREKKHIESAVVVDDEMVDINGKAYYKIELEGHQFYFRSWSTYTGIGSDLVHNPNCWCFEKDSITTE
jgi:hypothetical protein